MRSRTFLGMLLASFGFVASCGGDPEPRTLSPTDAGGDAQPAADGGPEAGAAALPGCADGAQLSCACGAGEVGTRVCADGEFGECADCRSVSSSQPVCVAGYYEGTAVGPYRSSGPLGPLAAPFSSESRTRLAFTLARMGGEEFFTVGNACVHVLEEGVDRDDGRSRFWLSGEVDCSTGLLEGEMRGFYTLDDVFTGEEVRHYYKGRITGLFDPDSQAFVDTGYKIVEPPVLLGDPGGGEGTWTAELREAGDGGPEPESTLEECLGDEFPSDDMFDDVTL